MKIVILGNQARAMANFWTVLIRAIKAAGHDVVCLAPYEQGEWNEALTSLGVRLLHYPLDRKGLNPLRDSKTLVALRRIFKAEQPDLLFAFTIKPVIYGALAAALAGTPCKKNRHVMITGLGYMFEADSLVKRLLTQVARLLYRLAFSQVHTVFFQNLDDKETFARLNIVPPSTSIAMSRGTGVDLRHFAQAPLPPGPLTFLLVGRLLEAKGLYEYHDAAQELKARYPEARFQLLGPPEHGPGSVPLAEVNAWHAKGTIEYLGETRDVRPYVAAAHVLVLPSYREGTPTSIMEGMSMGRAAVVTDAPGCRETVRQGENGFLVPLRDAKALAKAMERFIIEPGLALQMGQTGRAMAEAEFDADTVAAHIMTVMNIGTNSPSTASTTGETA